MQSIDIQVLQAVCQQLRQGRHGWLCTILTTYGSSPRPIGSLLFSDGGDTVVGSLSGGCVEDVLLKKLADGAFSERLTLDIYGQTREESRALGLPCGGSLQILVERVEPEALNQFEGALDAALSGQRYYRQIDLDAQTIEAVSSHDLRKVVELGNGRYQQYFGPATELVLVGVSLVAEYVAQFALALGYRVSLVDPRADKLDSWKGPDVARYCELPEDLLERYDSCAHCAILALTHDPRIDDLGMLAAIDTDAFYVGALGSARTSAKRTERLIELGIETPQLQRIRAPIGLDIGSKTPPEIAIAILGDIIAHYRGHKEVSR